MNEKIRKVIGKAVVHIRGKLKTNKDGTQLICIEEGTQIYNMRFNQSKDGICCWKNELRIDAIAGFCGVPDGAIIEITSDTTGEINEEDDKQRLDAVISRCKQEIEMADKMANAILPDKVKSTAYGMQCFAAEILAIAKGESGAILEKK